MSRKLDEALFDLKFSAKQMRKESEKLAKDETKEKALAAKALAKGQIEIARTHGVNAIQAKNLSLQMLQTSSKIDGCSKRLEHAMRLNQVSKTMESVVNSMGTGCGGNRLLVMFTSFVLFLYRSCACLLGCAHHARRSLKSMEPAKIAMSMSAFEKAFENIEVSVGAMGGAMETSTATLVPANEVDALMTEIAQVKRAAQLVPHCALCDALSSGSPIGHERSSTLCSHPFTSPSSSSQRRRFARSPRLQGCRRRCSCAASRKRQRLRGQARRPQRRLVIVAASFSIWLVRVSFALAFGLLRGLSCPSAAEVCVRCGSCARAKAGTRCLLPAHGCVILRLRRRHPEIKSATRISNTIWAAAARAAKRSYVSDLFTGWAANKSELALEAAAQAKCRRQLLQLRRNVKKADDGTEYHAGK
jgi:charged multivesicular body protein 1